MRVLFTGSRDSPGQKSEGATIWRDLESLRLLSERIRRQLTVVHGACPTGGDDVVACWAMIQADVKCEAYPANFKGPFGRRSGPIRNEYMVSLGADLCLGYPMGESSGTRGCMVKAHNAGIPTLRTEFEDPYRPLSVRLEEAGFRQRLRWW